MSMRIVEHPGPALEAAENPREIWLHCGECERFFQYGAMLRQRRTDACPFRNCSGVGLGFDIFLWDAKCEPADPRWPKNVSELRHGLRSPEMEEFYEAQYVARVDALLADFDASPERRALPSDAPRYLRRFLQTASNISWDLTEDDDAAFFEPEMASELIWDLPDELPRSVTPDRPAILAELRALFSFAARTDRICHAAEWRDLLLTREIEEVLLDCELN